MNKYVKLVEQTLEESKTLYKSKTGATVVDYKGGMSGSKNQDKFQILGKDGKHFSSHPTLDGAKGLADRLVGNKLKEDTTQLDEVHPTKETLVPSGMNIDVLIKSLQKQKKKGSKFVSVGQGLLVADNGFKLLSQNRGETNPPMTESEDLTEMKMSDFNSVEQGFLKIVASWIERKVGGKPTQEQVTKLMPQAMKAVNAELGKLTKTKEFKDQVASAVMKEATVSVTTDFATKEDGDKFRKMIGDPKVRKQYHSASSSTESLKRLMKSKGIKGTFTVGG